MKDDYSGNTVTLKDGRVGMIFMIAEGKFYLSIVGEGDKEVVNIKDITWHGSEGQEK